MLGLGLLDLTVTVDLPECEQSFIDAYTTLDVESFAPCEVYKMEYTFPRVEAFLAGSCHRDVYGWVRLRVFRIL